MFWFYINLTTILLTQFVLLRINFLLKYHVILHILFYNFNSNFTADEIVNSIGDPLLYRNVLIDFILKLLSNPLIHKLFKPVDHKTHGLLNALSHLNIQHLVNILKVVLHWHLLSLIRTIVPIKGELWGCFITVCNRLLLLPIPIINIFWLFIKVVFFVPFHYFFIIF